MKKILSLIVIAVIVCAYSVCSSASSGNVSLPSQAAIEVDRDYIASGSHQFNLQINSITYSSSSASNKSVTANVYGYGFSIYSNTYTGKSTSRRNYSLASAGYVMLSMENNSPNSSCVVNHSWNAG